MAKNKQRDTSNRKERKNVNANPQDFDRLAQEAEKSEKRKPGSQSNSSKQHNNGRGGGK